MNIKKSELGVSIIEIVIVTAIVGMISLLLFNLPNSLKLIGQSSHESLANQIATEKIESLRSAGFNNIANGSTSLTDSRLSQLPSPSSLVTIVDCPQTICSNNESVKQVSVDISWKEDKGSKKINIVTLISDGGLQ